MASTLRRKSVELQQKFEDLFWCEDTGFYVHALDGDKKQVRTIVSKSWALVMERDRRS